MMVKVKYTNVSLHPEITKMIDDFLKNSKMGYTSRAAVVTTAIRQMLGGEKTIS